MPKDETSPTVEKTFYKLTYRHLKHLYSSNFQHAGDLDSAIAKAREYCKVQKTDFINVEPFFTDLEMIINKKSNQHQEERIPGRAY
jgi:hypothetical protein